MRAAQAGTVGQFDGIGPRPATARSRYPGVRPNKLLALCLVGDGPDYNVFAVVAGQPDQHLWTQGNGTSFLFPI